MMRKEKAVATGLAVLTAVSCGLWQAASAQDWLNLLRNYGGYGGVGRLDRLASNQSTILNNVATGLSQMASRISAEISSGQLSSDEAAQLNAELNRIRAMHDSFLAGGYTNEEVNAILTAFNNFNSMFGTFSSNVATGYGSNYGYGYPGWRDRYGSNLSWSQVISLQSNILARINAGRANGSLSSSEARLLRSQYDQISRQLNRRQARGNLNTNPLVQQLINLDRRVSQMTDNRYYAGRDYWPF